MIVRVFPEIDDDLDEAFSFYESRRSGLGLELIDEYRRAIDRILQHPAKGRSSSHGCSGKLLDKFPFEIVYFIDHQTQVIWLVALAHHARKPGFWHRRLR